jgi:hypothetical protein
MIGEGFTPNDEKRVLARTQHSRASGAAGLNIL